jgi:hypothetical protein
MITKTEEKISPNVKKRGYVSYTDKAKIFKNIKTALKGKAVKFAKT